MSTNERMASWLYLAPAASRAVLIFSILAGICVAPACGTGSTGFDVTNAEQQEILAVAGSGTCVTEPSGLLLCSNAPPAGAVTALLGDPLGQIPCESAKPACSFTLRIEPGNLSPGTRLLGAVRPDDFSLPWRSSTALFEVDSGLLAARFETEIHPDTLVVLAALVYPSGFEPPDPAPGGIDGSVLTDFGAPQAAVRTGTTLVAPAPGERF